jgi:hypothetical protein
VRIENYDIEDFNLIVEKDFEQTIAYFANVPLADVQVLSVKQGSIIIDFKVNFANANDDDVDDESTSMKVGEGEATDDDNNVGNEYPPDLVINKKQEAFTNALRDESADVLFRNASTKLLLNSVVALVALEDLQENSIQTWRVASSNETETFTNINVTQLNNSSSSSSTNSSTNSTETTQESLGGKIESFYEANESNVQKAGGAAAIAIFVTSAYCCWRRLKSRAAFASSHISF